MPPEEPKTINIDGDEVEVAKLTPEQRELLLAVQGLDRKIMPIREELQSLQVARNAALSVLKASLEGGEQSLKKWFRLGR